MRRKIGFRSLKTAKDRDKKRSRSVRMRQDVIFHILSRFSAILTPRRRPPRPNRFGSLVACCYIVLFTCRMLSCTVYAPDVLLHRHPRDCPKTKGRPVQRPVGVFNLNVELFEPDKIQNAFQSSGARSPAAPGRPRLRRTGRARRCRAFSATQDQRHFARSEPPRN